MIDYKALKLADAALGIADQQAAADALNAQVQTVVRDVPCDDARSILLATGEYGALVLISRATQGGNVPDQLIGAAITAIATLDRATVIQATDPVKWAAVQHMVGAFLQAGAISQETHDALLAMHEEQVPAFPVAVTGDDIRAARSLA